MNDIDYELIERYLSGDMNAEARSAFDTRIQTEPELREAVQRYKEVQDTLRQTLGNDPQRDQLRQTLESNRQVFTAAPKSGKIRRLYLAAASAAAVIGMLIVFQPWNRDSSQGNYAVEKMISPAERGEGDTALIKATEHFNAHRFQQAVDALNNVIAENPDDAFAIYHRGLAYLELNRNDYARGDLGLIYQGESIFKYDAAFYIALSYYKENKKNECQDWLGKIPADAGKAYEKAQRLLKDAR